MASQHRSPSAVLSETRLSVRHQRFTIDSILAPATSEVIYRSSSSASSSSSSVPQVTGTNRALPANNDNAGRYLDSDQLRRHERMRAKATLREQAASARSGDGGFMADPEGRGPSRGSEDEVEDFAGDDDEDQPMDCTGVDLRSYGRSTAAIDGFLRNREAEGAVRHYPAAAAALLTEFSELPNGPSGAQTSLAVNCDAGASNSLQRSPAQNTAGFTVLPDDRNEPSSAPTTTTTRQTRENYLFKTSQKNANLILRQQQQQHGEARSEISDDDLHRDKRYIPKQGYS